MGTCFLFSTNRPQSFLSVELSFSMRDANVPFDECFCTKWPLLSTRNFRPRQTHTSINRHTSTNMYFIRGGKSSKAVRTQSRYESLSAFASKMQTFLGSNALAPPCCLVCFKNLDVQILKDFNSIVTLVGSNKLSDHRERKINQVFGFCFSDEEIPDKRHSNSSLFLFPLQNSVRAYSYEAEISLIQQKNLTIADLR